MPRLNIENREFQALVDLRQMVAPLIAKSVSRDRGTVTSLKVLNSWENLTIEISQLLLYLKEEQDLSEVDYGNFRNGLHDVLSLIDERVDPTGQGTENSEQAGELDENDGGPVDVTHHTKPNVDKTKYIEATRIVDVHTSPGFRFAIQVRACTGAYCTKYLYPCAEPKISGRKQLVRWSLSLNGLFRESPKLRNSNLKSVNVCKTIKKSFKHGRKLDVLVHAEYLLHDPKQWELIKRPPLWPILSLEDVLDVGASHFMPGDKVILAANLAHALRRMYSGDMTIREMTAKDIYFLFDPSNGMVSEGYNPYLACSLVLPRGHEKSDVEDPEKHGDPFESEKRKNYGNSIKFPMLVSFGELLMEIALGRKMGPYDCRVDIALLAEIDPKHYTGPVVKMVGKPYVDVIIECLSANQTDVFDSDSDSDWDHDSDANDSRNPNGQDTEEVRKKRKEAEERRCREIILAAVARLEEALTIFAKPDVNSPFQFKFQKPTRGPTTATKAWGPIDKAGRQVTDGQSFDDVRLNVGQTDQRVMWAAEFFKSAHDFYQSNIQDIPVTENNRIRIAVLDTGVDDRSSFWRGRSGIRKIKGSPIKKTEHFVGDSIDDELGHGTNVAAIISKIAPEADFYIAKISRGRETKGTQHIIDAIEWAVKHDVHVINMSFCLPKNPSNVEVRRKIEEATSKGVIFVAAASNHGNNESRGFPAKLLQVICIHAVDGKGNKSGLNPAPKQGAKNFGSLGVAVESEWDEGEVYLEGTSYATPVVTGMISNVLRFVQYAWGKGLLAEELYKEAFSSRGMSNILGELAERTSDGYDYIQPKWKIWGEKDEVWDVVSKMKSAVQKDMD
ncbi:hypothetical protein HIM_09769 [Hirsutella minnesotensis 3608]|uniref:Uncharacterized protein n=1 Tax=Hirsutella minnesotensis 3608 TaxID=1043627 RepID=A0A0F7ZKZ8_9HYPO|nr:hypothetical protein HIM_09769 [Hirsutella minnesotensis 3608]